MTEPTHRESLLMQTSGKSDSTQTIKFPGIYGNGGKRNNSQGLDDGLRRKC